MVVAGGLAEGDEPGAVGAVHLTGEGRLQHLQEPFPTLHAKFILKETQHTATV